ncbi:MAG: tyrosine-type recombinase/integrase [Anaerolineales bacterium]|nr:tyrosine-type recombinase/integrase [Anaerolineales bacterium]
MKEQINRFLDTLDLSKNTIDAYRYALRRFVEIVGEDAPLNTETFEKFLVEIKGYAPSTKQIWRSALLGLYTFCRSNDLAEIQGLIRHYTRKQGKRIVNFDREAVEKVIEYCSRLGGDLPALRDRAFVLTLADTGLRISEACALKRGDIDWLEARAVIVGKGDKQAVIRFSERSIQTLREYHTACASIEPNTRIPLRSQPVFLRHDIRASKRIKPISASGMWTAIKGDPQQGIKGRIEEAGVERSLVRIHDFRHYFVTMTYLAKRDIKLSQELARHSSIDTTNRYTHFGGEADAAYDEIFNKRK